MFSAAKRTASSFINYGAQTTKYQEQNVSKWMVIGTKKQVPSCSTIHIYYTCFSSTNVSTFTTNNAITAATTSQYHTLQSQFEFLYSLYWTLAQVGTITTPTFFYYFYYYYCCCCYYFYCYFCLLLPPLLLLLLHQEYYFVLLVILLVI